MATTTSITTTYAGEFAGKYISAALLSAPTIYNGGIEVKPNIKFKEVVKKLSIDGIVKNATCDFTDTSTITTTERILQPESFQVNLSLCKADFRSDWEAISMGYSAFDKLPSTFQDYLLGHVAAKVAEKTEQTIWQGANATAGEYDGFKVLALADATVIDVVAAAVTSANVIAELGKVVDAIPAALYGKEDLKLYVPQNVLKAYVRALGGFTATTLKNVAGTENVASAAIGGAGTNSMGTQWYNNGDLSFDGIPLFLAQGMPSNVMFAAQKSNLWFGTGLLSDQNEVKVIDMAEVDGSQNVRIIMRFTAGVQYGVGSEIVLYS